MKKHVKKNRNKKGSVLLTVVCFTLVCMIIASTALSLAAYATKNSNYNVRSTQAEITAEDYLKEFLKTFNGNYDSLQSMASVGANVNVGISTGAPNIGDCNINVKNKSGGILVTSTVNYAGKTESVSAFFSGSAPSKFDSTNVIETNEGMTGNVNAMNCEGDVLAEHSDTNELLYFHNSQSMNLGMFITQCNLLTSWNTQTYFAQSLDSERNTKSPVIISNGYMFWGQCKMTSTVPRVYDGTNDTGYVLSNSKFILLGTSKDGQIGGSCIINGVNYGPEDIDVYCYGGYLGKVPENAPDYNDIKDVAKVTANGSSQNIDIKSENPVAQIYGNLYCRKGGTEKLNGDLFVWNNGDTKIHGDLVVEGDLYIKSSLTVDRNLYCKGSIYKIKDIGNGKYDIEDTYTPGAGSVPNALTVNGSISRDLPNDQRSQIPTAYTSTTNKTSQYKNTATPNHMFLANNDKSKKIGDKYSDAYSKSGLDQIFIDEDCLITFESKLSEASSYPSGSAMYFQNNAKDLYIKDNCNLAAIINTLKDRNYYNNYESIKFHIIAKTQDVVVLMPKDSRKLYITVDFGISDPDTNVSQYFCYFMLESGPAGDCYNYNYCDPSSYTTPLTPEWDLQYTTIYDKNRFSSPDDEKFKYQEAKANNIFILPPDNCKVEMKSQQYDGESRAIQAIIYGPQSDLSIIGTGGSERVFLGQAFVRTFNTSQNGPTVTRFLAAEGSILEFIDSISSSNAIKLQYFTKRSN